MLFDIKRTSRFIYLFCFAFFVCCSSGQRGSEFNNDSIYPPTSILALNSESVYLPEISELKAKKKDESFNHLVISYFSDIHGSKANLERILEFCNHYQLYIDDILHTGDIVYNQFTDDFFYWKEAGADRILNTIGNHDTAYRDEANGKWDVWAHAGKDCYDKFFAPFISSWGVMQPKDAIKDGACYYYKDYSDSGIRLIVLDCMKYDSKQNSWFADVLSDAYHSNYAVICVSHFAAGKLDHSTENVFDSKSPVENTSGFINESASKLVDSYIDYGGEFICWLGGHIHIDSCAKLLLHPRQICINVAEAMCSGAFGDQKRVLGTKSQDLFNIVSVNRNTRELTLLRVGADIDVLGRRRFKYVINY